MGQQVARLIACGVGVPQSAGGRLGARPRPSCRLAAAALAPLGRGGGGASMAPPPPRSLSAAPPLPLR